MSMTPKELIEAVYEIAYGEDAHLRGFFPEEVIERLQEFSDNALVFEELGLEPEEYEKMDEQLEKSYRKGYLDGRAFSKDQGVHPLTDDNK